MRGADNFSFLIIVTLSCLVGGCFYLSTPLGLGMSPDSVGYLVGAQGMTSGQGLKNLSNQWPPLYTVIVGMLGRSAEVDVIVAARIAQSVFLIATACTLTCLQKKNDATIGAALLSTLFVLINPAFNQVIYYAWSELLFLLLLLLNIYTLICLLSNNSNNLSLYSYCLTLGVIASLALATRYVGITLVIFNIGVLLITFRHYRLQLRIKLIFSYLAVFICITTPWFAYYYLTSDSATRRQFHWHPISVSQVFNGLSTIGTTIAPWNIPSRVISSIAGTLTLGAMFFQLLYSFKRINISTGHLFNTLALSYFLFYLIFIIFSISTLDEATPLDNRILFPILSLLLLVFFNWLRQAWSISRLLKLVILFVFTLTVIPHFSKTYSWIRLNFFAGVEYASRDFQSRALTKYVLQCPKELVFASNAPWEFELSLQKQVIWLPRPTDMMSGRVNNLFNEQISLLTNKVDIIIITSREKDMYRSIGSTVGYQEIYSDNDGSIWIRNSFQRDVCAI